MKQPKLPKLFQLFYAFEDTIQPCIVCDEKLLPEVVYSLIDVNCVSLYRFMRDAVPGKIFLRKQAKGKGSKKQGILIVCLHPSVVMRKRPRFTTLVGQ